MLSQLPAHKNTNVFIYTMVQSLMMLTVAAGLSNRGVISQELHG